MVAISTKTTQPEAMESILSSICKVCQGIFQEGHRRRIRLRQIEEHLWESKDSAYDQDTYSDSSGDNGQATTDSINEDPDEDVSKWSSNEEEVIWRSSGETEDMRRFLGDENLDEGPDEDISEISSDEEEDEYSPSDEGVEDAASNGSSNGKGFRRSSDEDLDEMANEDASEVFSDDEDSRPSEFGGPDFFVYMHYPNLAMLRNSAEHGHCQSCHVLMHSLRSHNENLEEFLDQAQELEAQRLKRLQSHGDRAQSAVLDEDESDPNLESALRMHVEVCDNYVTVWGVEPSLSPEKHGEGRLFLTFEDKGFDYEFLDSLKLDVFCTPTESSASGHLESGMSFLASPGECEAAFYRRLVQV